MIIQIIFAIRKFMFVGSGQSHMIAAIAAAQIVFRTELAHISCIVRHIVAYSLVAHLEICVDAVGLGRRCQDLELVLPLFVLERQSLAVTAHRILGSVRTAAHGEAYALV